MTYEKLKVSRDGAVGVITLADPAAMNAVGPQMARELSVAFKVLSSGPEAARAIVLTGEGRGFCAGANLQGRGSSTESAPEGKIDAGELLETTINPLVTAMFESPVPIVTAMNGAAAGFGCSLALMGDIVLAAESAYFLQAFRHVGLVPDGGSTYLLTRTIGIARALELALLGEKLPAAKALQWGLVNRCVPDGELMATALVLARELAEGPASIGLIRQTLRAGLDSNWPEQLHRERTAQRIAGRTDDFLEGVSAFVQKRKPAFKGH